MEASLQGSSKRAEWTAIIKGVQIVKNSEICTFPFPQQLTVRRGMYRIQNYLYTSTSLLYNNTLGNSKPTPMAIT